MDMQKEAIVIAPKEETEEKSIGNIIAERIGRLAHENGEGIDYSIDEICSIYSLRYEIVDSAMRGLDYYVVAYDGELAHRIYAPTMLVVLKAVAEYFNTSVDYILGMTDRAY